VVDCSRPRRNASVARSGGQARRVAGDKDVHLGGGANAARQYLVAGLVDELEISLVPRTASVEGRHGSVTNARNRGNSPAAE
jgi:dihydrofolate reductase